MSALATARAARPHVVIAVDELGAAHLRAIQASLADWATIEQIPEEPSLDVWRAKAAKAQLIVGWPDPASLLEGAVEVVLLPSVGYDAYLGFGLDRKQNFVLCNGRGTAGIGVSEHAVTMMLCLARRMPAHFHNQQTRRFVRQFPYGEITGAVACVIGLGDIGCEIARKCRGLGMRVVAVHKRPPPADGLVEQIYRPAQIQQAVGQADHVFCCVPGGPENQHFISAAVLDAMPERAYFYNIARGNVVDEQALIARLREGRLAGAGLDVFETEPLPPENPLWAMENVIVTPHCGGLAGHWIDRFCDLTLTNLRNYRENKPLVNKVSLA